MLVKASIMRLALEYNKDIDEWLTKKGYKISLDDNEKYEQSLIDALSRSKHLKTKATNKANELKAYQKKGTTDSFDDVMASLIVATKIQIDDNITLARYNSIKKIFKRQQDQIIKNVRNKKK